MSDLRLDMDRFLRILSRGSGTSGQSAASGDCLFRVSYATDAGYIRETNEDSFFIDGKCVHRFGYSERDCYSEESEGTHIFGVFDGMGGEEHGEVASELCAKALDGAYTHLVTAAPEELHSLMTGVCRSANAAVCKMIKERGARAGGSTFTAACITEKQAHVYWLGDSRVYFYNGSVLKQLTRDQTVAAAKIAAGEYTAEEAVGSRDNHALMNFVGMNRLAEGMTVSACEPVPFRKGCSLLLCSDGLTDMIFESEIEQVLSVGYADPASEFVTRALLNGGMDNVTCVVVTRMK